VPTPNRIILLITKLIIERFPVDIFFISTSACLNYIECACTNVAKYVRASLTVTNKNEVSQASYGRGGEDLQVIAVADRCRVVAHACNLERRRPVYYRCQKRKILDRTLG
jgi:hypothetical protein